MKSIIADKYTSSNHTYLWVCIGAVISFSWFLCLPFVWYNLEKKYRVNSGKVAVRKRLDKLVYLLNGIAVLFLLIDRPLAIIAPSLYPGRFGGSKLSIAVMDSVSSFTYSYLFYAFWYICLWRYYHLWFKLHYHNALKSAQWKSYLTTPVTEGGRITFSHARQFSSSTAPPPSSTGLRVTRDKKSVSKKQVLVKANYSSVNTTAMANTGMDNAAPVNVSGARGLISLVKGQVTKDEWFASSKDTFFGDRHQTIYAFLGMGLFVATLVCVCYLGTVFDYMSDPLATKIDTIVYTLPIAAIWFMCLTTPKLSDQIYIRDELRLVALVFTVDCALSYCISFGVSSYYWGEVIFAFEEAIAFSVLCYAMTGYVVHLIEKDEADGRHFANLKTSPTKKRVKSGGVESDEELKGLLPLCCGCCCKCPLWCPMAVHMMAFFTETIVVAVADDVFVKDKARRRTAASIEAFSSSRRKMKAKGLKSKPKLGGTSIHTTSPRDETPQPKASDVEIQTMKVGTGAGSFGGKGTGTRLGVGKGKGVVERFSQIWAKGSPAMGRLRADSDTCDSSLMKTILKMMENEEGFEFVMQHVLSEFSMEVLLSLVEWSQWKHAILDSDEQFSRQLLAEAIRNEDDMERRAEMLRAASSSSALIISPKITPLEEDLEEKYTQRGTAVAVVEEEEKVARLVPERNVQPTTSVASASASAIGGREAESGTGELKKDETAFEKEKDRVRGLSVAKEKELAAMPTQVALKTAAAALDSAMLMSPSLPSLPKSLPNTMATSGSISAYSFKLDEPCLPSDAQLQMHSFTSVSTNDGDTDFDSLMYADMDDVDTAAKMETKEKDETTDTGLQALPDLHTSPKMEIVVSTASMVELMIHKKDTDLETAEDSIVSGVRSQSQSQSESCSTCDGKSDEKIEEMVIMDTSALDERQLKASESKPTTGGNGSGKNSVSASPSGSRSLLQLMQSVGKTGSLNETKSLSSLLGGSSKDLLLSKAKERELSGSHSLRAAELLKRRHNSALEALRSLEHFPLRMCPMPASLTKSWIISEMLRQSTVGGSMALPLSERLKAYKHAAHELYTRYVCESAVLEVNLSFRTRIELGAVVHDLDSWLAETDDDEYHESALALWTVFDDAIREILVLFKDSMHRFSYTAEYRKIHNALIAK